eukprot:Gb_03672 [translate_table: standard]
MRPSNMLTIGYAERETRGNHPCCLKIRGSVSIYALMIYADFCFGYGKLLHMVHSTGTKGGTKVPTQCLLWWSDERGMYISSFCIRTVKQRRQFHYFPATLLFCTKDQGSKYKPKCA